MLTSFFIFRRARDKIVPDYGGATSSADVVVRVAAVAFALMGVDEKKAAPSLKKFQAEGDEAQQKKPLALSRSLDERRDLVILVLADDRALLLGDVARVLALPLAALGLELLAGADLQQARHDAGVAADRRVQQR